MNFPTQRKEARRKKFEVDGQTNATARETNAKSPALFASYLLFSALFLLNGCSKSSPPSPTSPTPTALSPDTVLRVHWAGKQSVSLAASAYNFMRLWNAPEGRQLERQLIEKFAAASDRGLPTTAARSAASTLAPILFDAINEESFLEIRQAGATTMQMAFAIRLDSQRAQDWRKDLSDLLLATEGGFPSGRAHGWSLTSSRSQLTYEFNRVDDWVVFGAAKGTNALMQEMLMRIGREQIPFTVTTNNHWLTVEGDLYWIIQSLGIPLEAADAPRLSMIMTGDGANAITTGELTFAQSLDLKLDPWNFPANEVQGPVIAFSAVRGVGASLSASKTWSDLELGPAPNQLFFWADVQTPLQMHVAAQASSARETARALSDEFLTHGNAWLAQHALGSLVTLPNTGGIIWKDLPMIAPYLGARSDTLLVGGMVADPKPQPGAPQPVQIYPRPSFEELLASLNTRTNLVAYEWETTGARAESVHILGQLLRAITRHPQIPANTGSSIWLQAARNRLGNCTTTVTLAAPNRLAFERKSTVGLNVLELHLLADWMESPDFPHGLYSTRTPVGPALQPMKQ